MFNKYAQVEVIVIDGKVLEIVNKYVYLGQQVQAAPSPEPEIKDMRLD